MATSRIEGDVHVAGTFSCQTLVPPAGAISDSHVAAGAAISSTKLEHRRAVQYWQAGGSDIVAASVPIHTVFGATATLVAVEVVAVTAPTGGDKAFSVDLKKGSQASAFASVLTGAIAVNNTHADRQVVAGTLASTALADGDTLQVVVAVSGSTGSQGQGLLVTVTYDEDPT